LQWGRIDSFYFKTEQVLGEWAIWKTLVLTTFRKTLHDFRANKVLEIVENGQFGS